MDWKLALQLAGVVLGLLYLWLEYRADIRLWIVGLVMPLVHGALYYKSGLYADCAMQVYYILAGLYGLCVWAKKPKPAERETGRIARTPARMWFRMAAAYAAIHALLYLLLVRFTDSTVPFWDSLTTALCIMAYWMLSRKYVEQWLVWLAVDVVTVGLYLYKDIPLTAGLYLLYSALAVAGYRRWASADRAMDGKRGVLPNAPLSSLSAMPAANRSAIGRSAPFPTFPATFSDRGFRQMPQQPRRDAPAPRDDAT